MEPTPPRLSDPVQRPLVLVAGWFVAYGLAAVPLGAWLVLEARGIEPGKGGDICTGPLGYVVGVGLLAGLHVLAFGLVTSGLLHVVCGGLFLRRGVAAPLQFTAWVDALFWLGIALLFGLMFGVLGLVVCGVLAYFHARVAFLSARRARIRTLGTSG